MSDFLVLFLGGATWPALLAAVCAVVPPRGEFLEAWTGTSAVSVIGGLISAAWESAGWGYAAGAAVSLGLALFFRWFNRRRRDRAAKLTGAKSRQLRDAMARRMRELAPRPVLQPVPQGAS